MSALAARKPRLRLGMVGGGEDAFIGAVHRLAARLSDRFDLVAGAFSSEPTKAARSGALLGLAPDRSYASLEEMAQAEASRRDGVQAVGVVTPNHLHLRASRAFLQRGVHVLCEKPATVDLAEADSLQSAVIDSGAIFALAHTYSGYAMVRHARALVAQGAIGQVRTLRVEYAQDWLATRLEASSHKQAVWRADPSRGGPGGCLADIGTHAFHLAEFVSGQRCVALAADTNRFVPGRSLPDDAQLLLRFSSGASGALWASQVAVGCANALTLRIFGDLGSIEWRQEEPNSLRFAELGEPPRILGRAMAGAPAGVTNIPGGHPEGYVEAFAQLYADFADAIEGWPAPVATLLPGVEDGVRGMRFIEAALRSAQNNAAWTSV